ncbi:MAG: hypothetical protein QXJ28_03045 [Candidatus Pacearchaeota archaeon]
MVKKRKVLVVFYSKTGNTRRIARIIARRIDGGIDEVIDLKKREGLFNLIIAIKDAAKNNVTRIKYKINPKGYKVIIIGSPIWAGRIAPAIRTYLIKNKDKIGKIALFMTSLSNKNKKALIDIERTSKKPIAVLHITKRDIKLKRDIEKINEFIKKLKYED